jgi:arabinan endo-1,5-alpha-L-arabinosidase
MVLHVRKIFWTDDGWPVVSPQRFAGTEQTSIGKSELEGVWEKIKLNYTITPGFANEQVSAAFQVAVTLTLDSNGTINGDSNNKWSYESPWLELNFNDTPHEKVFVERGRDWENKKACLIFTGLDAEGVAVWGKK